MCQHFNGNRMIRPVNKLILLIELNSQTNKRRTGWLHCQYLTTAVVLQPINPCYGTLATIAANSSTVNAFKVFVRTYPSLANPSKNVAIVSSSVPSAIAT